MSCSSCLQNFAATPRAIPDRVFASSGSIEYHISYTYDRGFSNRAGVSLTGRGLFGDQIPRIGCNKTSNVPVRRGVEAIDQARGHSRNSRSRSLVKKTGSLAPVSGRILNHDWSVALCSVCRFLSFVGGIGGVMDGLDETHENGNNVDGK